MHDNLLYEVGQLHPALWLQGADRIYIAIIIVIMIIALLPILKALLAT
jgi:hypothetical protein